MPRHDESPPTFVRVICAVGFGAVFAAGAYSLTDPVSWLVVAGSAALGLFVGWWIGPTAVDLLLGAL